YGIDYLDQYRQAAGYVDRILKGEKPADLPAQAPTNYELAINMKTAKTLSLTEPDTLPARAVEVVEWAVGATSSPCAAARPLGRSWRGRRSRRCRWSGFYTLNRPIHSPTVCAHFARA